MAKRVENDQSTAFILENKPHEVPAGGHTWTMHGVIAAQRRAAGNVCWWCPDSQARMASKWMQPPWLTRPKIFLIWL